MAQMRLHRPGCFVRYALGDEADDVKLGGGERVPARGRSFAFAAAALGVGDRLLGRQRRALRPGGIEIVVTQGITKGGECVIFGVEDLEAHRTGSE